MQVQLELWPTSDPFTKQTALWKQLDEESRNRLVIALARLIRKSVSVHVDNASEEGEHE